MIVHQNRIELATALDFGPGHTTFANQALLTRDGTAGGEPLWSFDQTNDQYVAAAIPPPGIQDPSTNYPGVMKSMEFYSLDVVYTQSSTNAVLTFDFEYGIQALSEGDALSAARGETFSIAADGNSTNVQTRTDTLATPVAVEPNEWIGLIYGRLGSTDGANEIFRMRSIVLNMRPT